MVVMGQHRILIFTEIIFAEYAREKTGQKKRTVSLVWDRFKPRCL